MIERSRSRIHQTGEVFTPLALADEMLSKLYEQDQTLFTEHSKNFLDPAAGDGNILVRVLHFKLLYNKQRKYGDDTVPVCKILRSIYGVDIMPDNVEHCRTRMLVIVAAFRNISLQMATARYGHILRSNIVCNDSLDWDFNNWQPKGRIAGDDLFSFEPVKPAEPTPEASDELPPWITFVDCNASQGLTLCLT